MDLDSDQTSSTVSTPPLDATIAICTYRRKEQLKLTLTALHECFKVLNDVRLEVLIINNSPELPLNELKDLFPELPLRIIDEPRQGVACARNRALREARGPYILFTDDDVSPHPAWLATYLDAFSKFPDYAFYGGTVRAELQTEPPLWIEHNRADLASILVERSLSPEGTVVHSCQKTGEARWWELVGIRLPRKLPIGANFALNTEHDLPQFDENLGVKGTARFAHEDDMMFLNLLEQGNKGLWLCDAVANHRTNAERFKLSFVLKTTYYSAQSRQYLKELHEFNQVKTLRVLLRLGAASARIVLPHKLRKHSRVYYLLRVAEHLGTLVQRGVLRLRGKLFL